MHCSQTPEIEQLQPLRALSNRRGKGLGTD
jgi:hypothetical protein